MPTSIRLPEETERRLDQLATSTGRTKAYYLRQIIEQGLGDLEDYYLSVEVRDRVRRDEEGTDLLADFRTD
jgi:RHH-type rel operon transcriptional repressor/antitoxin RelB